MYASGRRTPSVDARSNGGRASGSSLDPIPARARRRSALHIRISSPERSDSGSGGEDGKRENGIDPQAAPGGGTQWNGDTPWPQRSLWHTVQPFRGMWADVRRRAPFFVSDWTDALTPRNFPTAALSVLRMFFINLMPAIAYVLDMYDRTDGSYGINEVILASALAAIVFSLLAVQPLTFVGVTGLTNLMNYTIYDIFHGYYQFDRTDYLRLQCWALIWAAGFHFLTAAFNLCDYTRWITDMTAETFGLYVGVIYVQKGVELLIREFKPAPLDNATGWLAVTIAVLFTVSVYFLTQVGSSTYLPFHLRRLVGSLAFVSGCVFWTGFSHFPHHSLALVPLSRLPITRSFFPTLDRKWLVDFWNLEVRYIFVAAPLGFLFTLLFYFDHNVSSVMAQARRFPIRKPAGFHWDFFVLGITTFVSGILGLPAPNGLVPQAPDHTDSLSVYQQKPWPADASSAAAPPQAVQPESAPPEPSVIHSSVRKSMLHISHFPRVAITYVVEQRLTHFLVGLLTVGAMTRPILVVLGTMPRALFAGVFMLVGWASIEANPIITRTLSLLQDRSALPPSARPRLRRSTIATFVGIQWLFFAMTIAISQTIAGIGFPVIIVLMIPCRVFLVPRFLSPAQLQELDAPTATAEAVLCSLGGSWVCPRESGDPPFGNAGADPIREQQTDSSSRAPSARPAGSETPHARAEKQSSTRNLSPNLDAVRQHDQKDGSPGQQGPDCHRHSAPPSSNATPAGIYPAASASSLGSRMIETFNLSRRVSARTHGAAERRARSTAAPGTHMESEKDCGQRPSADASAEPRAPPTADAAAEQPGPGTKPSYIRVENPPRGPGTPVPGVQWRGGGMNL
ncbi:hypothetical protein MSPP1_001200 [Malassezia sp. CBS 17886]|nr:hypothetical protein MSPP1_001200 [Malassezia sp. CBS 17886]